MKRGAASRAASKLKSDMEDRNQFEKEIKHGQVIGSWEGKRSLYKRERDPELLTNAPLRSGRACLRVAKTQSWK